MSDKQKDVDDRRLVELLSVALPQAINVSLIPDDGAHLSKEGLTLNPFPIILYGTLANEVEQALGFGELVAFTHVEHQAMTEASECRQRDLGYIPHKANFGYQSNFANFYASVIMGMALQKEIEEDIRFKTAVLGMNGLINFHEYEPGQYQGTPATILEK